MTDGSAGEELPSVAQRSAGPGLTVVAALWILLVASIVVGALCPQLPVLGVVGASFESTLSLHVFLGACLGIVLSVFARRKRVDLWSNTILCLSLLVAAGALLPLMKLVRTSREFGAPISWTDHLLAKTQKSALPERLSETVRFAKIGGQDLYADIYLPSTPIEGPSAVVLMMHGGGFIHGKRSQPNGWDRWLAGRGYAVFDIDYRLAPPPTWNQAAQDAACAMGWIAANAQTYHVDGRRILVAGQSAGAGLALQLAFGIADGTVTSSCGGEVPKPVAVFALYPPDDFSMGWNFNTALGPARARVFLRNYIGGAPEDFPARYAAVSAVNHVRADLPPMLIAAGDHDHLVPYEGHVELMEKLNRAGVPNILFTVPYGEHGYDIAWSGLGTQITRHVLEEFLQKYFPVTAPVH
jgi:acetyl esterase/lipase